MLYLHTNLVGTPGEIRTPDPWVRSPVLYPLSYGRIMQDTGVDTSIQIAQRFRSS